MGSEPTSTSRIVGYQEYQIEHEEIQTAEKLPLRTLVGVATNGDFSPIVSLLVEVRQRDMDETVRNASPLPEHRRPRVDPFAVLHARFRHGKHCRH